MKIRNGFVSNSSSSSYLIFLPYKPVDYGELCAILFGNSNDPIPIDDHHPVDVAKLLFDIMEEMTIDEAAMFGNDYQEEQYTSKEFRLHEDLIPYKFDAGNEIGDGSSVIEDNDSEIFRKLIWYAISNH